MGKNRKMSINGKNLARNEQMDRRFMFIRIFYKALASPTSSAENQGAECLLILPMTSKCISQASALQYLSYLSLADSFHLIDKSQ